MLKKKLSEDERYQEKAILQYLKGFSKKHPKIFLGWSDYKYTLFVRYLIAPKKVNVPRKYKKEFDQVSNKEITSEGAIK